jgi:hypothetical protein
MMDGPASLNRPPPSCEFMLGELLEDLLKDLPVFLAGLGTLVGDGWPDTRGTGDTEGGSITAITLLCSIMNPRVVYRVPRNRGVRLCTLKHHGRVG